MQAARIHRFGPPDVIELEQIERPAPSEGEVLVQVGAAGVGPWDAWVRSGKSAIEQPLPLTLGSDISGRVVALGAGVKGFALGQEVFGVTNPRFTGGYAEFAVAGAAGLAPKPRALSQIEAASAPVVAVTARQMLFEHGRVRDGDRVLIHGAGGNVGAYALRLAKAAGADVVGTALGPGVGYARSLQAGPVVDTSSSAFAALARSFDVVIDTVGGELQRRSFDLLKPGGRLVSSVSQPDPVQAQKLDVQATFMLVQVTTAALLDIANLFDAGVITPHIAQVFPLEAARLVHEMLDDLKPRPNGKLVLELTSAR